MVKSVLLERFSSGDFSPQSKSTRKGVIPRPLIWDEL